jgi:hypothetical protein
VRHVDDVNLNRVVENLVEDSILPAARAVKAL